MEAMLALIMVLPGDLEVAWRAVMHRFAHAIDLTDGDVVRGAQMQRREREASKRYVKE